MSYNTRSNSGYGKDKRRGRSFGTRKGKKTKDLSNKTDNIIKSSDKYGTEPELKKFYTAKRVANIERELEPDIRRVLAREQRSDGKTGFKVIIPSRKDVIDLHKFLIAKSNISSENPESDAILNNSALQNALDAPDRTVFGKEIYPSIFEKTSALLKGLIQGHAFQAGNKRIGYGSAYVFLRLNDYKLVASADEVEQFTIDVATKKLSDKQITKWLKEHSTPK